MALRVEIYGKDDCRFCAAAVAHCQRRGYPFAYHDVSVQTTWEELLTRLDDLPDTVPQIFIGIHHIGGFDDLKAQDEVMQQIIGGH